MIEMMQLNMCLLIFDVNVLGTLSSIILAFTELLFFSNPSMFCSYSSHENCLCAFRITEWVFQNECANFVRTVLM